MTRRDFELIAKGIREAPLWIEDTPYTEDDIEQEIEKLRQTVADSVSCMLALSNPHFDRARFIAACLGEELWFRNV